MKILVCTDGSEQSKKALEKASIIATGCNINEVAVIHVYDHKVDISSLPADEGYALTEENVERFKKLQEVNKEESKKILTDALNFLEERNIKARAISKEGYPSHTIVEVGCGEGFDMIFMGSRGIGGLKKVLLGSVSNAVVQEAEGCTVVIVR